MLRILRRTLRAKSQRDFVPDRPGRSGEPLVRFQIPPIYPDEKEIKAWAMGADVRTTRQPRGKRIKLRVTHGNLAFSRNPVMVGHYQGDGIFGAERFLDTCLDGKLSKLYDMGIYPGPIDSSKLLLNSDYSKPGGALIVGLGEPRIFNRRTSNPASLV